MKKGIFITGTDTGVGKTICSALLMSATNQAEIQSTYFKPVQAGSDDDTFTVTRLFPLGRFEKPIYSLKAPLSPNRAAKLEGENIDLNKIKRQFENFENSQFIVEGAGGILVPLNETETNRDLMITLGLPIVVVASTKLGTINHTLLTLEIAQKASLQVRGLILMGDEDPGLREILQEFGKCPVLAQIPVISKWNPESFGALAREFFPQEKLREIFK